MKNKYLFKLAFYILASLVFLFAFYGQNRRWKGTVEEEKGIEVIKNPGEPLYGEITFELEEDLSIGDEHDDNYMFYRFARLEIDADGNIFALDAGNARIQKFDKNGNYLQTIGKKGQGPGEFNRPSRFHIDRKGNIYVYDTFRKIHIFDNTGRFLNSVILTHSIKDYKRGPQGHFLALTSMVDRIDGKPVMLDQISILDAEFKLLKTVVSLPQYTPPPPPQPINIGAVYGPELVLCPIGQDRGVYAISSEYKCHVINTLGTISHIFTKDESPQPFSKKEKERIINSFKKSIERSGSDTKFTADFPKHKPLFHAILNDDKGRIYIQKYQIIPTGDRVLNYDLFSEEGYYLHEVKIPIFPQVIKNGYVYAAEPNPDTGYIEVRRYKIKNWEQIKSGIN